MKRDADHFRGCLLGGAIGDALGAPVEFLTYDRILKKYGNNGIQDLMCYSSGLAEITDDTQMTLFTAEGLLRAYARGFHRGIWHPPSVVFHAYQRWLLTQGYPRVPELEWVYDGWLLAVKELHARRAPGITCLSSLESGTQGSIDEPLNNSKGCGGVMRVAPVGLFFLKDQAFHYAAEIAALTHGHPSGYLSAGALGLIISLIIEGQDLVTSIKTAISELQDYANHDECAAILIKAMELVGSGLPAQEAIALLGEGWVGEEALAIAVFCALRYPNDIRSALIAAVNHSGDSDSTGAITGNILGAYLGMTALPEDWISKVELKDVIFQMADDLLLKYQDTKEWWERYPGY